MKSRDKEKRKIYWNLWMLELAVYLQNHCITLTRKEMPPSLAPISVARYIFTIDKKTNQQKWRRGDINVEVQKKKVEKVDVLALLSQSVLHSDVGLMKWPCIICLCLSERCRCAALQHPLHERPVCQCILKHLTPDMCFLFPSQRRRFNIREGVQQFLHSELCLRLQEKRPLQDYLR